MAKETKLYKNHRSGSATGKLHVIFDKEGKEAALKAAKKLGILPHSARAACSRWSRKIFTAEDVARQAAKNAKAGKVRKSSKAKSKSKGASKSKASKPAKVSRVRLNDKSAKPAKKPARVRLPQDAAA